MTLSLVKIISGGQTGADQGALAAARELGLATGGYMPKGWRTDSGPMPELELAFGMMEHSSSQYQGRTFANVAMSDATFIFGSLISRGCSLTKRYVDQTDKPVYVFPWRGEYAKVHVSDPAFISWLSQHKVRILNCAGNRERTNRGITQAIQTYLLASLRHQDLPPPF